MRDYASDALSDEGHEIDDVDEIVGEVFLLAWTKWDRPKRLTLRWLRVATDNKIRDRRRRALLKSRVMGAVEQALVPSSSGWDEWDRLAVRNALSLLKDRERHALALSYVSGWSTQEIANQLKMTPSAVGAMLSRARAKLRAAVVGAETE